MGMTMEREILTNLAKFAKRPSNFQKLHFWPKFQIKDFDHQNYSKGFNW